MYQQISFACVLNDISLLLTHTGAVQYTTISVYLDKIFISTRKTYIQIGDSK